MWTPTGEIFSIPERALSKKFGQWGYFVAQNAWIFIITTGLFGCFSSIGLFWLQTEKDIDVFDIYFPRNGRITQGLKKMRDDFPDKSDTSYFPWQDNGEYLTLSVLIWGATGSEKDLIKNADVRRDVQKICNFVKQYSVFDTERNKTILYSDVCAIDGLKEPPTGAISFDFGKDTKCLLPPLCEVLEPLPSPVNHWEIEPDGKAELSFQDDGILGMLSDPVFTKSGYTVKVSEGGISARLIFFLRKASSQQLTDSYAWVRPCFNDLDQMVKSLPSAYYALYSLRIQLDEWGSVFERDSKLFALAIIFLVGFSVIASSSLDCLASRSLLALAGILSTILAIITGISAMSLMGVALIQVAFLTPFIILGVGIDGAFVMMFTWAKTEKLGLKAEERVSVTLDHCFVSIFISNLTSFLAFTVGSFTPYMAVNISCYYLASMIVALTFFELTFFTACLSIHTKRVQCTSNRGGSQAPKRVFEKAEDHNLESTPMSDDLNSDKICRNKEKQFNTEQSRRDSLAESTSEKDETWALNIFERYLIKCMPKIILHDVSRVIILIGVGVLLAIATRSTIKMAEYMNEVEYQPDNSNVTQYYHTEEQLFRKPTVVAFVIDEKIDYEDRKVMRNLRKIIDELIRSGFFLDITDLAWCYQKDFNVSKLIATKQGKHVPLDQSLFKNYFKEVRDQSLRNLFKNDINLNSQGEIEKSRFFLFTIEISQYDSDTIRSFFQAMYPILDASPYKIYATSIHLSRWERNITMKSSIWTSIGIGLVCCFVVMCFLLGDFRVIFLSLLVTACSMITVLGYMGVWGITYNMSTYIEVLLLIGLCVDYASHSGHSYKRSRGETSKMRAEAALESMGVPLVNAAVSSILGIVMLAFSSSYGMRTLFITALFLFTFSFFYGVCVLPVLLSFFGPVNKSSKKLPATELNDTTAVYVGGEILLADSTADSKFATQSQMPSVVFDQSDRSTSSKQIPNGNVGHCSNL